MIWFTADTHYNNVNIIRYCSRPFRHVDEMNSELVKRWNAIVSPDDTVFHLGDVTLQGWETARKFFSQVNGKIFVVAGGHDKRWIDEYYKNIEKECFSNLTILVGQYTYEIEDSDNHPEVWVLSHYAMRVWDRSHYGSFHLYGHSHGTLPSLGRSLDVGVDCWNYAPVSIDTLRERLLQMPIHNPVTR